MSCYIIELADCALTPYAIETESGTEYGWSLMPKRKVDLDELLRVADECDAVYLCDGWENARGCKVERAAAVAYDLELIGYDLPCRGDAS